MKMISGLILLFCIILVISGCELFQTEVTFYIGVTDEAVRYVYGDPDKYYTPISVEFDGNTIYAGEYEEVTFAYDLNDSSEIMVIDYKIEDPEGNFIENGDFNSFIYSDEGEYISIVGFTSRQHNSLTSMNDYLSDAGLSTFGSSTGSTSSVCGTTYEGPTSDAQRDSYCQAAYAYLCGYGLPLTSTEVQTQCNFYDAMNDGGPECPYCQ